MKNYCKDCQNRYVGCHIECEKYKKFKEDLDIAKKREERRKLFARAKTKYNIFD